MAEEESTETGTENNSVEDLTEKVVDDKSTDIDKAKEKETEGALSGDDKASLSTIKSLLDEYGVDSPEELKTFVGQLATIKDQVGDTNLEELKKNSELLKRYQKVWAEEKEKDREDKETPEQTIDRLKRESKEDHKLFMEQQTEQEETRESSALLKTFTNTVKSTIKAQTEFPAEYHGILTEFLGIENEIHEIDLDDKVAVKRITKAASKKIMAFEQDVIKRYLKGKAKVVKMTTSTESTPPKTKEVKTLKDARGVFKARLTNLLK